MKKFGIVLLIGLCICVAGCSPANDPKTTGVKEVAVKPIINVTQFSRISPNELTKIMGKAENVDKWNFQSPNGETYATTTYEYNKGNYEFLVIDNTVVRFTLYGEGQTFKSEKELFALFGITPGPNIKTTSNTGTAYRYETVTDKIGDFWVITDLQNDKALETVKVTYDLRYF